MKPLLGVLIAGFCGVLAATAQVLALGLLQTAYTGATAPWMVAWTGSWSPQSALAGFIPMQLLAAISGAAFFLACSPAPMRRPAWQGLLFNATFIFFLPVGGQLVLGGVLLLQRLLQPRSELRHMEDIDLPTFVPKLLDRVHPGSTARARSLVMSHRVSTQARMTAMNTVRAAAPHTTDSLLHTLLDDEQDEVRLLAYGILDQSERRIMKDIQTAQASLERNRGGRHAAVDHARLAELYWELVYQGLVQGSVYRYTLERAQDHAREALAQRPKLAGMHFLLGRCALLLQAPQRAQDDFGQALRCGMPPTRLAAWQAEALFLEKRLDAVKDKLQHIPLQNAAGDLQAVVRYWQ